MAENSILGRRSRSDSSPEQQQQQQAKVRRPRPLYSCSECRRLKMKCDRQVPCSNCVRRQCVVLCQSSSGANSERRASREARTEVPQQWQQRLSMMEDMLNAHGLSIPLSPAPAQAAVAPIEPLARPSAPSQAPHLVIPQSSVRDNVMEGTSRQNQSLQQVSHELSTSQQSPGMQTANRATSHAPPSGLAQSAPSRAILHTASNVHFVDTSPAQIATVSSDTPENNLGSAVQQPNVFSSSQHDTPLDSRFEAEEQSYGTLVISKSGQSRYLGRTAASEWLRNQEAVEGGDSPPMVSRGPSPMPHSPEVTAHNWDSMSLHASGSGFPFAPVTRGLSTVSLMYKLPAKSDGQTLFDAYFRHFSWHFNAVSRDRVQQLFDSIYAGVQAKLPLTSRDVPPEHFALLYAVFAMGAYYNLEFPPDDPSIEEYLSLSKCCLAKSDFLARPTMAAVQTLHIMGHLLLSMDCGKNGESSWPLFGLGMRMAQGMGLHRDGERWHLPKEDVEERRRVFWELFSTEALTSNCFSRPYSMDPDFVDTLYPQQLEHYGVTEFQVLKFELSTVSRQILAHAMKVRVPPYSRVQELHDQMNAFESNIPFHLRCRPVLTALPSAFPDSNVAVSASPPVNRRNLQLTLQQFTLAMNIAESLVFLHRPYYAKALHESPSDPARSQYAQSYLVVVERCNTIVLVASNLYNLYPQIAARHWWIWYHALNSAACMGALILKYPRNVLAPFALALVDTTLAIYTSVVTLRNSPRMTKNLRWLERLRARVSAKMVQTQTPEELNHSGEMEDQNDGDDTELLGWKTRLIQRAGQGLQTAETIRPEQGRAIRSTGSLTAHSDAAVTSAQQADLPVGDTGVSDFSDEALLNYFWDPDSMLQGERHDGDVTSLNWWLSAS